MTQKAITVSQLNEYIKGGKVILKVKNGKAYAEWSPAWKNLKGAVKNTLGFSMSNSYNALK